MIEGLQPYAEYKESGLSWLDRIPVGWDEQRSKYLFREVDRRSTSGEELRLSMSQRHGLIPSSNVEEKRLVSKTNIGAKICEPGDLVLNRLKAHLGVFALAPRKGIVSPDYTVLRAIGSVNGLYFCTVYRSPYCGQELRRTAKGIVEGFWRLYTDQFYDIRVPVPPPDEQAAIVRFLDHANRKIDGFIRAKRKLIGLLNEQKQAIIHRAVTRGLDPNVSLKPSGSFWLGDIPKHWDIRPIKQTLLRMDYGTSESSTGDGKYRVLTMGHIQNGRVLVPVEGGINQIPAGLSLKTNDLLFNRTNSPELVGKVGIFSGSGEPPVTFASYLVRLRVRSEHNPSWLNYLLNSFRFWAFARSQALVSLHQANLNSSRYGRMNIPVPTRADQDSIVEKIRSQNSTIDTAITRTEREIALMQEYRTRLTADIVTGKLDVRDAVAKLPDTKELGPTDEEVSIDDNDAEVNDSI